MDVKRGAIWWSKVKCPNDNKVMSATRMENNKFVMFCEKCWYDYESPFWDGVGDLPPTEAK